MRTRPVDLDAAEIAVEVNDHVGRDVETAESVARWITDNPSTIEQIVRDGVVVELTEVYE